MSIETQPEDINFLSPLGYKFTIPKLPNFNYFIQRFEFPTLELNRTNDIQTPFNKVIMAGDHVTFNTFSITFKIDENMQGYFELYDWIVATGFPESFEQYRKIAANKNLGEGVIVDANLLILNSAMAPNIKVTFNDVVPERLSGFSFDSTLEDVRYLTASAEFRYRQYTYERL
jgi:hypothetical protein